MQKRRRRERVFRRAGQASLLFAAAMLAFLLWSIASTGWQAFRQTVVRVPVDFGAVAVDATSPEALRAINTRALVMKGLQSLFPEVQSRADLRQLQGMLSVAAPDALRDWLAAHPELGQGRQEVWLPAADAIDQFHKHGAAAAPQLRPLHFTALTTLQEQGRIRFRLHTTFFTASDSREPEVAGILGSLVGSLLTLAVAFAIAFPLGVAAAVYLEEFATRKSRWKDLIEVNINNLAAVPSIVFGLLGLAVFIGFFGMPRSAPLVGGFVLTLLTLPTIIIASRAALKAVPPSIREAALGMGASRLQMVMHHVMPLAMLGMLTGAIIGMARALGESAPLLMIGMVAFIVDVPSGFVDPATALPVQVFLWSDLPERGFVERTSGAIIVLLLFLIVMNATAVILRNKFEKRW